MTAKKSTNGSPQRKRQGPSRAIRSFPAIVAASSEAQREAMGNDDAFISDLRETLNALVVAIARTDEKALQAAAKWARTVVPFEGARRRKPGKAELVARLLPIVNRYAPDWDSVALEAAVKVLVSGAVRTSTQDLAPLAARIKNRLVAREERDEPRDPWLEVKEILRACGLSQKDADNFMRGSRNTA